MLSRKFVDKKMSNQKTRKIVDAGLKPYFQKGRYRARLEAAPFQSLAT
jgi:hypothetical protein